MNRTRSIAQKREGTLNSLDGKCGSTQQRRNSIKLLRFQRFAFRMSALRFPGGSMPKIVYRRDVRLPTIEEFVAKYPNYASVRTSGRPIFETIVKVENFVSAETVTNLLGMPAVTAVADALTQQVRPRKLTGFEKQMAGAIMCVLMEQNGYAKTGRKGAVSRPNWSRGELYKAKAVASRP